MPSSPQLLLVGNLQQGESQQIADHLFEAFPAECIRTAATIERACRRIAEGEWLPDLIVVFQDWPEQFPRSAIERLIAAAPLARLVCCYGPWCDSDGRTRDFWPLAVRVPISVAQRRIERELALLRGESTCLLPMTAGRDEIFGFDNDAALPRTGKSREIVVRSPDRAFRNCLEEALRLAGHRVLPDEADHPPAHIVLWDIDPWDETSAAALAEYQQSQPEAAILALAGFPREHLTGELRSMGVRAVIPKLAPFDLLLDAIEEAVRER